MCLSQVTLESSNPSPQLSLFLITELSTILVLVPVGTTCSGPVFCSMSLYTRSLFYYKISIAKLAIFIPKLEMRSHQNHLPIDPRKNVWQRGN